MKRIFNLAFYALGIASVLALATSSEAVIINTPHATNAGAAGPCSACHIPHGGGANRLWPTSPSTNGQVVGVVSGLCGACHTTEGAYTSSMSAAQSNAYVYATNSHGVLMARGANEPWSTDVANSGLPYAAQAGNMECTSCHNVHSDPSSGEAGANRPFLRDNINALCARCHTNRHYVGAALSQGSTVTPGAWGTGNVGLLNPGSHPVGSDITGELDTVTPDSAVAIPTHMSVVASGTGGWWSLGGKRWDGTATGGVTCVTCHAVHGTEYDPQDTGNTDYSAVNASPFVNYLATEQASDAAWNSRNRSIANGTGDFNALCEACHGVQAWTGVSTWTTNNPATAPGGGAFSDATHNVNPGAAGTFSHPIDSYPSSVQAGVASFGTSNWPEGNAAIAGANVLPVPICESCHVPHPTADAAREDLTGFAPGQFILRDSATDVCDNCHTTTPSSHHPVGIAYDSTGVSYLRNVTGAAGDTLTCATCHTSAHNWSGPSQVGLDLAWLPLNNGRDETTCANDQYNLQTSRTCMDCHYGMDTSSGTLSPTFNDGITGEAEYQVASAANSATHYIGAAHTAATNWRNAPLVSNIFACDATGDWANNIGAPMTNANTAWSRWGNNSTNPVTVCESCHELEPDKNVGHLLLAAFTEGSNGDDGDADGHDQLCEGCHGVPAGTHPLTGSIVSRTGAATNTTASWIRAAVFGNATMDTANDRLSCDSCHQVHDANPNSNTFILDAPDTDNLGTAAAVTLVAAGTVDAGTPELDNVNAELTGYVVPTLSGRGGNFTGYCDQCHMYAY